MAILNPVVKKNPLIPGIPVDPNDPLLTDPNVAVPSSNAMSLIGKSRLGLLQSMQQPAGSFSFLPVPSETGSDPTQPSAGIPTIGNGLGAYQPGPATPSTAPTLPANYGFNDLANYEEARRNQFGQDSSNTIMDSGNALRSNLDQQYAARRSALATSLTDQGKQTFDLENPGILEDLNNRGVFTSPTAVANAQAQAMKEIALANGQKLDDFDSQRFSDLTGLDKELYGASTDAKLQGGQDALDAGLDLRRGQLESQLQQSQAQQQADLAQSLAAKQRSAGVTSALIGAGGSLLGNSPGLLSKVLGVGSAAIPSIAAGSIPGLAGGAPLVNGAIPAASGIGLGGAAAIGGAGLGAMALDKTTSPIVDKALGKQAGAAGNFLLNPIGNQLNAVSTIAKRNAEIAKSLLASGGTAVNGVVSGIHNAISGIGSAISHVFCFDPETPIALPDGTTRKIEDICLGETIRGGEVESIRISNTKDGTVYSYKGVIVTGSHAVNEGGTWIRVENSSIAEPVAGARAVISLVTSGHRIYSNDIEFADEHETDNYEELTIDQSLAELNNEQVVGVSSNGI